MAKFSDVNNLIGADGGAEAMFIIKENLKAAGWAVMSSSDGTTYFAASDGITTFAAGAGGMNNASAWFRIQEPGGPGRREYTFQRATAGNDHQWRIKYSAVDKFTAGTPGITQTPTTPGGPGDEAIEVGGGTDAAPTFASMFTAAGGGYRFHTIAQSTAVTGTTNAYGWWAFAHTSPAGVTMSFFFQEPLLPGTFPTADQDPVVRNFFLGTATVGNLKNEANGKRAWFKYNLAGETNAFIGFAAYSTDQQMETIPSVNPYTLGDDVVPIFAQKAAGAAAANQRKGYCNFLKYQIMRVYPNTIDVTSVDAYVCVNQIAIPWETNTSPIL